jgi:pimeloyl-ACP methyl ester carboxylesterase
MSASLPGEQADDPVSAQPGSAFVETETIRLHYLLWQPDIFAIPYSQLLVNSINEETYDDEPPIILLHGLSATADTWRLVAPRLCRHHQIIAFDLRGHGESDCPDHGYDLATVAEDIVSGMAALGLGQVILAGHGWGARVALALAARHPALISHLILVDCPIVEPRRWPGMTRQRFLRQDMSDGRYASRQIFLQSMRDEMTAFWSPPVESIVLATIRTLPDGSVEARLASPHQRQIREALWEDRALSYYGKVQCPVLLVPAAPAPQSEMEMPERLERAEDFSVAKGYMAAQVARAIRRCTVLWMPDTAHDIQLQRPQRLAAAILSFVRR